MKIDQKEEIHLKQSEEVLKEEPEKNDDILLPSDVPKKSLYGWNTSVISSENIYAASRTMDPHWHIIIDKELCSVRAHSGPLLAAWLIIP
jgi:hypothetical protein